MTNESKPIRYVELVLNPCSLTYGVAPCTASIGGLNTFKCYNSTRTCQDPANYDAGADQIIRWSVPTEDLPIEIEAKPCISAISRRPLKIDPGESLGVRESVTVSMLDSLDNDTLFDPYPETRVFNPYYSGTYWGKFVARWGSLEGNELRTIDGFVGQDLGDMTTRYYVVDSTNGPDNSGNFSIVAKDIMKFMDDDKAQWPLPSSGTLLAAINSGSGSLTLNPVGIGATYPSSGVASIGDEKVTYTRVGDVVTLTGRGLSGTEAADHEEGETFQDAEVYTAQNPAEILLSLLDNGTDIDSSYFDFSSWEDEVNDYLGRLYSAEIMQPTPVRQLVSELLKDCGLTIYTDTEARKIILRVLRQEVPVAAINDDVILAGSISTKPLEKKRVSDVWVYYGKINPLEKQSEKKNFAAIYAKVSSDPIVAIENRPRAIREIMSRWITTANLPAADAVADKIISRYENTPKLLSFQVPGYFPIKLNDTITVQTRILQDAQGQPADPTQAQIVQLENTNGVISAVAEEFNFSQVEPPGNIRVININSDTLNVNLKSLHDSIYTAATSGDTIRLIIDSAAIIGSASVNTEALNIGSWPAGIIIEIDGSGRIQGRGGEGTQQGAEDGGDALVTSENVDIIGNIEIWSGGGAGATYDAGGGPGAGWGGAGYLPGNGATTEDGGSGSGIPKGGDPGQDGQDRDGSFGGSAGTAVNGFSFLTISGSADIKGPTVG